MMESQGLRLLQHPYRTGSGCVHQPNQTQWPWLMVGSDCSPRADISVHQHGRFVYGWWNTLVCLYVLTDNVCSAKRNDTHTIQYTSAHRKPITWFFQLINLITNSHSNILIFTTHTTFVLDYLAHIDCSYRLKKCVWIICSTRKGYQSVSIFVNTFNSSSLIYIWWKGNAFA